MVRDVSFRALGFRVFFFFGGGGGGGRGGRGVGVWCLVCRGVRALGVCFVSQQRKVPLVSCGCRISSTSCVGGGSRTLNPEDPKPLRQTGRPSESSSQDRADREAGDG